MSTTEKKSIPEMSHEAQMLARRLAQLEPGETVPYAELDRIIGKPVQQNRGLLRTARNAVERDYSVVLECVRKEGVRRMRPTEIGAVGVAAVESIRRKARRTRTRIARGTAGRSLSDQAQRQVSLQVSVLGTLELFTRPKSIKKIEERVVENDGLSMASSQVARLFANDERTSE
jgi:hypothetical protein